MLLFLLCCALGADDNALLRAFHAAVPNATDILHWMLSPGELPPVEEARPNVVFVPSGWHVCDVLSASFPPGGPIVLVGPFDGDNFGVLSDATPFTADWGTVDARLRERCNKTVARDLEPFLADDRLLAWFVTQAQYRAHPKVVSVPLGVSHHTDGDWVHRELHLRGAARLRAGGGARSPVPAVTYRMHEASARRRITDAVNGTWGGALRGTFHANAPGAYASRLLGSRFVLCPPGLGHDSYRVWEALACGAVPVVQRQRGWDRSVRGLPVLAVGDLARDAHPSRLEAAWDEATRRAGSFHWRRLTGPWWAGLVSRVAAARTARAAAGILAAEFAAG